MHETGHLGEEAKYITYATVSYKVRAEAHSALGDPGRALEHWRAVADFLEKGKRLVQDQPTPAGAQTTRYRAILEAQLSNHEWVDEAIRELQLTLRLREPESPEEHSQRAEADLMRKAYDDAVHHFMEAFKAPEFAAHSLHLYNAACAASLRSTQLQADEAARLRALAMDWLRRSIEAYRKSAKDPAALEEVLTWAREGDPDLAVLRGTPAFDALFVQVAQPVPAGASGK